LENGKRHVFPLLVTRGGGHAAIASGRLLRTGIRRVRRGQGFSHVDENDRRITDGETLQRIRALAVPRAWGDVWICPHPNGHIQALGTDARGRRQYCYHDAWRRQRDREKFDQMVELAQPLPATRRRTARQVRDENRPASASSPAPFACSTAASSGSAARTT
jgi:DNA topoisomerase IB